MYCKNCGEVINDNQAICLKCGVKVGEGDAFCENCGSAVEPNAEYCMNCGVAAKKALAGQDKVLIAVICFLIGVLGIHNFMMGEIKKGVFKIIMTLGGVVLCGMPTLICEILVLVEFVRILTDKYVVDPNKIVL